jgi:hypothetical protein
VKVVWGKRPGGEGWQEWGLQSPVILRGGIGEASTGV